MPTPEAFSEADKAMLAAADRLVWRSRAQAMNEQAIKVWLDAVWTVLIEANGYFDKERPFDKTLTRSAPRHDPLRDGGSRAAGRRSWCSRRCRTSAGKLLDLLAVTPATRARSRRSAPRIA